MYTVLLAVSEAHAWNCRQTWLVVTEGGSYDLPSVPHVRFKLVSRWRKLLQEMTLSWVREPAEA